MHSGRARIGSYVRARSVGRLQPESFEGVVERASCERQRVADAGNVRSLGIQLMFQNIADSPQRRMPISRYDELGKWRRAKFVDGDHRLFGRALMVREPCTVQDRGWERIGQWSRTAEPVNERSDPRVVVARISTAQIRELGDGSLSAVLLLGERETWRIEHCERRDRVATLCGGK